jgi:hypothetical protein
VIFTRWCSRTIAQALEDLDRLLVARRIDRDRLEAACEGGVLLDVLAVLVEGRGADALDLAAGERGLEHVGRVDRALGAAGADQRVQLVDEEDDVLGAADLVHDGLDALLELAAVLGAGDHHRQVEHDQALLVQDLGDVAADDALGEAFDDGGLADARLAEEDGVVLGAAAEDLHDALDLVLRPITGRACLPGEFGEVAAEGVEGGGLALALALRGPAGRGRAARAAAPGPGEEPPLARAPSRLRSASPAPRRLRTSSRTSSSLRPRFMRTWAATPSCSRSRPSSRCSVPT